MRARFFASLSALSVVACAAEPTVVPPVTAPPPVVAPVATELTAASAPRALRRDEVRRTVRAGLGAFLQRVELHEQPAFEGGRFKGFRLARLAGDPSFWSGVDLKPGDVLISVNGSAIERPEQALAVFHGLAAAPELRVVVERAGARRELVFPIEDSSGAKPAK